MAYMLGVREWTDGFGSWKSSGNKVRFNPNGRWNDGYEQPIHGNNGDLELPFWYVQYWRYRCFGLSVTAHVLASYGNYMVIEFNRGEPPQPPCEFLYCPQETIVPAHYNSFWVYYPPRIVPTPALDAVVKFIANNNVKNAKAIAGRLTRFETNNKDVLMPPGTASFLVDYGYHLAQIAEHRPGPSFLPTYRLHHLLTRNVFARLVRGILAYFTVTLYQRWRQEECYQELRWNCMKNTLDLDAGHARSTVTTGAFAPPNWQTVLSSVKSSLWPSHFAATGKYNGGFNMPSDLKGWMAGTGGPASREELKETLTFRFLPHLTLYLHLFLLISCLNVLRTSVDAFWPLSATPPSPAPPSSPWSPITVTACHQVEHTEPLRHIIPEPPHDYCTNIKHPTVELLERCFEDLQTLETDYCFAYTPSGKKLMVGAPAANDYAQHATTAADFAAEAACRAAPPRTFTYFTRQCVERFEEPDETLTRLLGSTTLGFLLAAGHAIAFFGLHWVCAQAYGMLLHQAASVNPHIAAALDQWMPAPLIISFYQALSVVPTLLVMCAMSLGTQLAALGTMHQLALGAWALGYAAINPLAAALVLLHGSRNLPFVFTAVFSAHCRPKSVWLIAAYILYMHLGLTFRYVTFATFIGFLAMAHHSVGEQLRKSSCDRLRRTATVLIRNQLLPALYASHDKFIALDFALHQLLSPPSANRAMPCDPGLVFTTPTEREPPAKQEKGKGDATARYEGGGTMRAPVPKPITLHTYKFKCDHEAPELRMMRASPLCGRRDANVYYGEVPDLELVLELAAWNSPHRVTFIPFNENISAKFEHVLPYTGLNPYVADGTLVVNLAKLTTANCDTILLSAKNKEYLFKDEAFHSHPQDGDYGREPQLKAYVQIKSRKLTNYELDDFIRANVDADAMKVIHVVKLADTSDVSVFTKLGYHMARDPTNPSAFWLILIAHGNPPLPTQLDENEPCAQVDCLEHKLMASQRPAEDLKTMHRDWVPCASCGCYVTLTQACAHSPTGPDCVITSEDTCHICLMKPSRPHTAFEHYIAGLLRGDGEDATSSTETSCESTVGTSCPETHPACTLLDCPQHKELDRKRAPARHIARTYCPGGHKFWWQRGCSEDCTSEHEHHELKTRSCHLCHEYDQLNLAGTGNVPPSLPDYDTCLIDAISAAVSVPRTTVWIAFAKQLGPVRAQEYSNKPFALDFSHLDAYARLMRVRFEVEHPKGIDMAGDQGAVYPLKYETRPNGGGHWTARSPMVKFPGTSRNRTPPPVTYRSPLADKLVAVLGGFAPTLRYTTAHANAYVDTIIDPKYSGWFKRDGRDYFKSRLEPLLSPPAKDRNVRTGGVLGRPGAGKTTNFLDVIASHLAHHHFMPDITVITHSDAGRSEIKQKLNLPKGRGSFVKTFETAFAEVLAPVVLIDDAGAFPPGYVDALVLAHPQIALVLFTMGPGQHVARANNPDGTGRICPTVARKLSTNACCYLTDVYRHPRQVALAFGWKTHSKADGTIIFGTPPAHCPTVDDHNDTAAASRAVGHISHSLNDCQGLTFTNPYALMLSPRALNSVDDEFMYTALSRGKADLYIVEINNNLSRYAGARSAILRGLVAYQQGDNTALRTAIRDHEIRNLPAHLLDPTNQPAVYMKDVSSLLYPKLPGTGVGHACIGDFATQVSTMLQHPTMHTGHITYLASSNYCYATRENAVNIVPHYLAQYDDPILEQDDFLSRFAEALDTHDALGSPAEGLCDFGQFDDLHAGTALDVLTDKNTLDEVAENLWGPINTEGREFNYGGTWTEQIDESSAASSLFPKHHPKDEATMNWSIHKRMRRPRPPPQECFNSAYHLMAAYEQVFQPIWPEFDDDHWDSCAQLSEGTYLAKGLKRLQNICERGDPSDVSRELAEIFMKSQSVTKIGSLLGDAKAAQLIYSFCTWHLAHMGPAQHYMFSCWRSSLPEHILLLNGLTHDDYAAWVEEHWDFKTTCFTSDYTAFDASQREWALSLDVQFMRKCHVPESLINEYLEWATVLETHLGPLGILIFSGFKFTWMFNTFNSMSFNALKYDIPPQANSNVPFKYGNHLEIDAVCALSVLTLPGAHTAMTFSGDDTGINLDLVVRHSFQRLGRGIELTSVQALGQYLDFCGNRSVPGATYANPELMTARILYRLSRDSLDTCLLSYADLAGRGVNAANTAHDYLTDRELACVAFNYRVLKLALRLRRLPSIGSYFIKLMRYTYRLI
jgi:hypothetical protein